MLLFVQGDSVVFIKFHTIFDLQVWINEYMYTVNLQAITKFTYKYGGMRLMIITAVEK